MSHGLGGGGCAIGGAGRKSAASAGTAPSSAAAMTDKASLFIVQPLPLARRPPAGAVFQRRATALSLGCGRRSSLLIIKKLASNGTPASQIDRQVLYF